MIPEPVKPSPPVVKPLELTAGREVETEFWFDGTTMTMELTRVGLDYTVKMSAELDLDELAELHTKVIAPALAYRAALEEYREKDALYSTQQAEQRTQADRDQREAECTFRIVQVHRSATTVTRTVHRRACAALSQARRRQSLGTVVMWSTPNDVARRVLAALDGGDRLRFCGRCSPVAETVDSNNLLKTAEGSPRVFSMERAKEIVEGRVWDAHHHMLNDARTKD